MRRVAGERADLRYHVTRLLVVYGQTVWRHDVRDVAVPLAFAGPWWKDPPCTGPYEMGILVTYKMTFSGVNS